MRLEPLGWNGFFEAEWNSGERLGVRPGRVVAQHREMWIVAGEFGESAAEASGKLRQASQEAGLWPAIGDWVALRGEPSSGMAIHEVLPRRTEIVRKEAGKRSEAQVLAANVDTFFLVMGLDGDFSPRRVERYLVQVWESGARAVVVLNKSDLQEQPEVLADELRRGSPGVDVHCTSAKTGAGLERLAAHLGAGQTIVLLGSSGTGKSTLVNRLLEAEQQATAPVRVSDSRGRHTTTARQLFFLPTGAMVIDTPGMRELQLWDTDGGVEQVFLDVEDLARNCRFRNCRHTNEPGCAVRLALEEQELTAARLESYFKLQREQQFLERKVGGKARQEAKSEHKRISRAIRKLYREREGS